jgi:hypothetical protein
MPLIQPEKKITTKKLDLYLPSESLQELRDYAAYLNGSSVQYVLTQLIATLGRDKAFEEWKKTRPADKQTPALSFISPHQPDVQPNTQPDVQPDDRPSPVGTPKAFGKGKDVA